MAASPPAARSDHTGTLCKDLDFSSGEAGRAGEGVVCAEDAERARADAPGTARRQHLCGCRIAHLRFPPSLW